jgi:2-amino-4-hydroxy-6-hydroxymethyldihydropteridine diphosphokinase
MADCLIALGANLGDRAATLDAALAAIDADAQTRIVARSAFYETTAIGGPAGQQAFLNAAARIETSRDCDGVWNVLTEVERQLGRVRDVRWGPRTVDLDLLLYGDLEYGDLEIATPRLEIPHPRMAFRRFVLAPAAEVSADMRHPTTGWTVGQLLAHLDVKPNYVAIAGPIGAGKSHLAAMLTKQAGWRMVREPIVDARLASYYADPLGEMLATERAILRERVELLDADAWPDADRWTISDFWFDQTLAFARWAEATGGATLAASATATSAAIDEAWRQEASRVARPKFLVWLDAPNDVLLRRIAERGRAYELRLTAGDLDALRATLLERLRQEDVGPVLRLDAARLDQAAIEVRAAAEAMA